VPVTTERPDRRWAVTYVVEMFLLAAAWFGPTTEAATTLLLDRQWDWGDALTRSLTFGLSWGLVFPLVMLLANGRSGRGALRRSVAGAEPPPDADPDEWRPRLRDELTRLAVARWLLPLYFVVEAALLAAVAITTDEGAGWLWGAAGLAGVAAAAWEARIARRRSVVERLQAQLSPA
jgi:hypothetical protein